MTTITSDVVQVTIQGITGEIDAKIDTGATQTSMHADEIQVSGEDVVFKLNGRTYRAPLESEQEVSSSDGGTQSRPVIRSTIEIAGKSVDTLINLNDRSEMPQKVLIGQDVIRSAELTLQLSDNPEDEEVSKPGTPEIYSPMDQPEAQAPQAGSGDVELQKKLLKLFSGLQHIQQELVEIIGIINGRNSK